MRSGRVVSGSQESPRSARHPTRLDGTSVLKASVTTLSGEVPTFTRRNFAPDEEADARGPSRTERLMR